MNVEEIVSEKPAKDGSYTPSWKKSPNNADVPGPVELKRINAPREPVFDDYGPPSTLSEATKDRLRGISTGK